MAELKNSQKETLAKIESLENEEKENVKLAETLKEMLNAEMETLRDLEREKFTWKMKEQELSGALGLVVVKENNLRNRKEIFENELKEGVALIGQEILSYKDFEINNQEENNTQELPAMLRIAKQD